MKNSMGFPANRSFISIAASLLLGLSLFLASAGQAHANDAIDALEKVCGVADGFCGPDFKSVAQDCFHASKGDEIKCTVTILSAVSGAGNVGDKIQTIIECAKDIKNLDAVQGDCKSALDALNLGDQYNEAVGIIKTCAKIQNASGVASTVDDVIVCADGLLDSSFIKQADLNIPSWVDSLFDLYVAIRGKDYLEVVKYVGVTVACAIANYLTGIDACALLKDLYAAGAYAYDAVGTAAEFVVEFVKNQSQNMPLEQYYAENWVSQVEGYARNRFQNGATSFNQFNDTADAGDSSIRGTCSNYFDSHTLSRVHANRVCDDMLVGSAKDGSPYFQQKGFNQLVTRRGAQYLLPKLIIDAITTRNQALVDQGMFKFAPLSPDLASNDPWKAKPPTMDTSALYGMNSAVINKGSPFNAVDAWPAQSIGFLAHELLKTVKLPEIRPVTYAVTLAVAQRILADAEAKTDFNAKAQEFMKSEEVKRIDYAKSLRSINQSITESVNQRINELLKRCATHPSTQAACNAMVNERDKLCKDARESYRVSHPIIADFDNGRSKAPAKEMQENYEKCQKGIDYSMAALTKAEDALTAICKPKLDRAGKCEAPGRKMLADCRQQVVAFEAKNPEVNSEQSSQKADMLGAERDALRQKCEADVMKFAQALPNLNQLNPNNPNSPAHDPSTPISAVPKLPLTQNRFVPTAPATSSAINTPVTVAAGATDSFITMTSVQIKGNALEACLKSSGGSTTKSLSLRFETSNTEKLNLSPSWVTLGNEGHVVVANSTSCVRFDLPPHTNSQCKIFRVAIESGLSSKDSNQRNHVREIKTVCQ